MGILLDYNITDRKKFKRNRVKSHQRFNLCSMPLQTGFQNPDSMLMDKIINNIKQEMKGKNEKKTNGGSNS